MALLPVRGSVWDLKISWEAISDWIVLSMEFGLVDNKRWKVGVKTLKTIYIVGWLDGTSREIPEDPADGVDRRRKEKEDKGWLEDCPLLKRELERCLNISNS